MLKFVAPEFDDTRSDSFDAFILRSLCLFRLFEVSIHVDYVELFLYHKVLRLLSLGG